MRVNRKALIFNLEAFISMLCLFSRAEAGPFANCANTFASADEQGQIQSADPQQVNPSRQLLVYSIQALEHQLLALKSRAVQSAEWGIAKDSDTNPTTRAELIALVNKSRKNNNDSLNLRVSDNRYLLLNPFSANPEIDAAGYFVGHSLFVLGGRFLFDGRVLSWGGDHTLNLWEYRNGLYKVYQQLGQKWNEDPNIGHVGWVLGATQSEDGRILSWSDDYTLILWKLMNGRFVIEQRLGVAFNESEHKGHNYYVTGAKVLPGGKILSWSLDHTVILWKAVDGKYEIEIRLGEAFNEDPQKGHVDTVKNVYMLPDGSIASVDRQDRILLWQNLAFPKSIQLEIDSLTEQISSLKAELSRN